MPSNNKDYVLHFFQSWAVLNWSRELVESDIHEHTIIHLFFIVKHILITASGNRMSWRWNNFINEVGLEEETYDYENDFGKELWFL
jgi:hypothetical protein